MKTGEQIGELHDDYIEQSEKGCYRLVFSPCGQYLAACNCGNKVHVWNIHNGTLEMAPTSYGGNSYIKYGIPFYTMDGTLRVAGIGGIEVVLWDTAQQETLDTFKTWNPSQRSACFSADSTKKLRVRKIVFSPTGEYLVSANNLTPIKVWHVTSGIQIAEIPRNTAAQLSKIEFSRSGEHFVILYKDSFAVSDALHWEKQHHVPLTPQKYPGWKLDVDLIGRQFFTRPPRGPALVWNFKSDEQIGLLDIEPCIDTSIYKGMLQDLQRAQERQREITRRIRALKTSTRHNIIAGGMWGEIRLWDATTFKVRMALIQPIGCQAPYALAFSPCGNYLASGSRWDPQWKKNREKTAIRLWDITTGENIHTFWAHPTDILSINFSPDGELLASGSYDGTILLWDMNPYS